MGIFRKVLRAMCVAPKEKSMLALRFAERQALLMGETFGNKKNEAFPREKEK